MYLKVVTPRVEFEIAPGDVVQAGIVITNSEVGCGTLAVQPLVYRLICRNGLIAADRAMRKTHVGRMSDASSDEVTVFRDDTLQAEDKAFFLKVRDVVEAAVSEATFRQVAQKMQKTLDELVAEDDRTLRFRFKRRFPRRRFVWLMGADNLAQFHKWRNWRQIVRDTSIKLPAECLWPIAEGKNPWKQSKTFARDELDSWQRTKPVPGSAVPDSQASPTVNRA